MCGFAGLLCPAPRSTWDLDGALDGMLGSIRHRGPDDSGVWTDAAAGARLGFRRLSIIDLSPAGHQPMVSATGRWVIVFNGEVYNHAELRARLESPPPFRGHSDTEVILAAVEAWGVEATIARLRGMFAIALWDKHERELWLVRDRMGIKPLYVLQTADGLAFASEARAFHHCPLYDGAGDADVARRFLRRLYVSGSASILRGVERLAPGELVRFAARRDRVERVARSRYWDLRSVARQGAGSLIRDEREAAEAFLEVLREAVRLRLFADVPVGAFLSGGIDSTAVVGLMQELSSEPVRTFTVGFDDRGFDESDIASEVAARIGTSHTRVHVPPRDLLALVDDLATISDEPMANPSIIPTVMVSRVARRDVTVALSGDGGDECFGGYNRYGQGARLIRMRGRLPRPLRRVASGMLSASLAGPLSRLASSNGGGQHSAAVRAAKIARVLEADSDAAAYETLLDVGWTGSSPFGSPRGTAALESLADSSPCMLSRMMLHDQMEYLPDDLLTKVDRATMWESLEGRVPLLDHEVVAFSWRVDPSVKIKDGQTKWPIRRIAARYVPEELLNRPKMGFTVPIAKWLRTDLEPWARETLQEAKANTCLFDPQALEREWSRLTSGQDGAALGIWAVVVLQSWATRWGVDFGG